MVPSFTASTTIRTKPTLRPPSPLLPHQLCYRSTFLGSRALAGTLLKHKQLSAKGPDGLTLEEVLKATGVQRPAEAVAAIALDPKKVGWNHSWLPSPPPQYGSSWFSLAGIVWWWGGGTEWVLVSSW
jgi:hypothetical protein